MNTFMFSQSDHLMGNHGLILKFKTQLETFLDVTKTSAEDFEDAEELYDAVGGVLHEATENEDEDEIKEICNGIMNLIKG